LGEDKKFYRILKKGGGEIRFSVPRKEQYILKMRIPDAEARVSFRIKNKSHYLNRSVKYLNENLIQVGSNIISFSTEQPLKIRNLQIFPSRITRYPNYKNLLTDRTVLFLPGFLRYYIRPFSGEKISLKLNLFNREKLSFRLSLRGDHSRTEKVITLKSGQLFQIPLLENQFQEVILEPLHVSNGYLRVEESSLIQTRQKSGTLFSKYSRIRSQATDRNVLIVLLDAARSDHVGYHNYFHKTTPHIDKLAEQSLIFNNCYSEASYTLASTGTLLTGLPPDFHGVVSKDYSSLDKKIVTLAQLFQDKGYFCGAISGNPNFGRAFRYDKGFSEFIELFISIPAPRAGEFVAPFSRMLKKTGGKPFFVYLHIREPHHPFRMPPPFLGRFQQSYIRQNKDLYRFARIMDRTTVDDNENLNLLNKLYDENLNYGDWGIGEI
jgi:hypothetical protein